MNQWNEADVQRFLIRIGFKQFRSRIAQAGLKRPSDFIHLTPDELEEIGLNYWKSLFVILAFQNVCRRRTLIPAAVRDDNISVARCIEWDSDSLATYLEMRELPVTASRVKAEAIGGFVFANMDPVRDLRRLDVGIGEASRSRQVSY